MNEPSVSCKIQYVLHKVVSFPNKFSTLIMAIVAGIANDIH